MRQHYTPNMNLNISMAVFMKFSQALIHCAPSPGRPLAGLETAGAPHVPPVEDTMPWKPGVSGDWGMVTRLRLRKKWAVPHSPQWFTWAMPMMSYLKSILK